MVTLSMHPGATLKRGSATVELGMSRPELRRRRRRGTVTWSPERVCVDVPGSTQSEHRTVVIAVAAHLFPKVA